MIIKKAEYVVSSPRVELCPRGDEPEYAFIGRSNVGKSSLINMLTNQKSLAKTSAMPGKTMLINHFKINDEWYLVDLPGYGYAKRGKKAQDELTRMISEYVLQREQMINLFVLIDVRHDNPALATGGKGGKFEVVSTEDSTLVFTRTLPENKVTVKVQLKAPWTYEIAAE